MYLSNLKVLHGYKSILKKTCISKLKKNKLCYSINKKQKHPRIWDKAIALHILDIQNLSFRKTKTTFQCDKEAKNNALFLNNAWIDTVPIPWNKIYSQ